MKVLIKNRKGAILYSQKKDINKTIIISISNKNEDKPLFYKNDNIIDIHYMFFNDLITSTNKSDLPRQSDFNGLKNFIDKYKNNIDIILVHCGAGISRSSAVASAICRYLNLYEYPWDNDLYVPNILVYKLSLKEFKIYPNEDFYNKIFNIK